MPVLEIIAGAGAVQGTLLLLLVVLRYRRKENLPLSLLLLAFSLRLATIPTWNADTMLGNPWLLPLVTPLPFLFGPLLWWYAHTIADDTGTNLPAHPIYHVLPYVMDVAFNVALVLFMSAFEYAEMIGAIFRGNPPLHLTIRNAMKVLVNVVYVGLAIHAAFRRNPVAELTAPQRLWLRALVTVPVISLGLFGFVALYPDATAGIAEGMVTPFTVLAAAMALLIYVFSFLMLAAPEVPRLCGCLFQNDGDKNSVSEEDRAIATAVTDLLNKEIFRDPDLSLESLARRLGTHPNHLSRVVNCVFRESFPALIQRHRIQFFITLAESDKYSGRTILDLAFEAGFSSKSTFNRVFKGATKMSPTQYRASKYR